MTVPQRLRGAEPTCPKCGDACASIPVSRIVAVLAEQLLIVERIAAQKEDPLWRDWYAITNIAEILGIHGPVMAELARQRKGAA